MLRLYLLRHGKSDWGADYRLDHDRPLANRGIQAAAKIGKFLHRQGVAPEVLVTSSAVRAKTTLALVADAAGWSVEPIVDQRLYGASPVDVLQVVEDYRGVATSILACGHQPWCSGVIAFLTGQPVPRFPTTTVACLATSRLGQNEARLEWLQRPRELDQGL